MTLWRQFACLVLTGSAAACSSASPTTPGGGPGPTMPVALSVTYAGQIRVDSCAGCVSTNGVLATRPFVLRLNEVSPGRVEGTFDFGYHSNYWAPLTPVSGTVSSDRVFRLSGTRASLSAISHSETVVLTSLVVSELPSGSLTGSAEFTVSGTTAITDGAYRSTLVSGAQSGVGTASVGIDGRWRGEVEILSCTGDLCSGHQVPGRFSSIAFTFATQSSQLQGVAGADSMFYLPRVNAPVALRGTFAGQALTASADAEVIEFIQSDHVPPNTEAARVRVTVTNFNATIDTYNRLQGEITYTAVRTTTYPNAQKGQVQSGTFTVRLRDVVPKPL